MATTPLTVACILALTQQYNFPREALWSLFAQEAGEPGIEVPNLDSHGRPWSYDLGPYQVNNQHVAKFARLWGKDQATTYRLLRDDGCANAKAAAHLLNEHWKTSGDIWQAIGWYHSRTEGLARKYREKVYEKTVKLYQSNTANAKGEKKK
jgi:hypothetical protein